jgi:hypothetical protein
MRTRHAVRRGLSVCLVAVLAAPAAGCGGDTPVPAPSAGASGSAPVITDARIDLAARAAAAEDRRFTALYTLDTAGRDQRSVVVTAATDGTWRVDVPGAALGGTADIAIASIEAGVFQCTLTSAARSEPATCVRIADQGKKVPNRYDPGVQHLFSDWLNVLTDRQAALAVSAAQPLVRNPAAGVPKGACFAVESIAASLKSPVDAGLYCYADDGVLTGARIGAGTLLLAAQPAAPPPSVDLPGPVVAGEPLGKDAPPPPPTTPSPSPSSAVSAPA